MNFMQNRQFLLSFGQGTQVQTRPKTKGAFCKNTTLDSKQTEIRTSWPCFSGIRMARPCVSFWAFYDYLWALFGKTFFYSIAHLDESSLGKEFQGLDPCRNAKTQRQDGRNHRLQLNLQGREIQEGDHPI